MLCPFLRRCTSIFICTAWNPFCYSIASQYICFQPMHYMCDPSILLDCCHSCLLNQLQGLEDDGKYNGHEFYSDGVQLIYCTRN